MNFISSDNISPELKQFIPTAKMIVSTFGNNCEVVLHDLAVPQHSVVFVCNNTVTGRSIGQSFDHLIKDVLLSGSLSDDYRGNYTFVTADGKKIKSSTSLIRNAQGRVIGALCINYDITPMETLYSAMEEFLATSVTANGAKDNVVSSVGQVLDDLIDSILKSVETQKMTKRERLEIISFMDEKGVFLVKGSVEKVAAKMNISSVTVYGYLDEVRKNYRK